MFNVNDNDRVFCKFVNNTITNDFELSFDGDFFEGVLRNSKKIICNYVSYISESNIFSSYLIYRLLKLDFKSIVRVKRNIYFNKKSCKFYLVYDGPQLLWIDVYEVQKWQH